MNIRRHKIRSDNLFEHVPDNYDRYVTYERENERLERLNKQREIEEEIEMDELPFLDEYQEGEEYIC